MEHKSTWSGSRREELVVMDLMFTRDVGSRYYLTSST